MSEAATFLLDNDSEQDRRRGEPFSVLHPTRLLHYAQIVHAARQAGPGDRWIALHANLAATALRAAVETNKRLGLMLVLAPVKIETATALFSCFRYVVISPRPGSLLPFDELADVLVADNKDGLFLGGSVDQNSETVTLWRGNGKPLVVPMSSFPPSGDGKKPDFDRFSVSDYGHTLRFGEYESSADVVLYEHDAEFRAKLNETRRAEEQGFGPACGGCAYSEDCDRATLNRSPQRRSRGLSGERCQSRVMQLWKQSPGSSAYSQKRSEPTDG